MKIYYQNPGSNAEFLVDVVSYEGTLNFDQYQIDQFKFDSGVKHIRMGAKIVVEDDSGKQKFVGVVNTITHKDRGTRSYSCESVETNLTTRYILRAAYPGGAGLYLSDILSSDAPPQSGDNQYIAGMIWLSRSAVSPGLITWSSAGVGKLAEWGPRASGRDIYLDGRKLTQATYSALTGSTDQFAIAGSDLYIYGSGSGDTFGLVAIDGFAENWIRLGEVDSDPAVDMRYSPDDNVPIWKLLKEFVEEAGMYIRPRRSGGYLYLDISTSPYVGDSSEDEPLETIRHYSISERMQAAYPPHSAVIGIGHDGETIAGQRYTAGIPHRSGVAWTEERLEVADAWRPPSGVLDQIVEDSFSKVQMLPPLKVTLFGGECATPGGWYSIDGESRLCQSIEISSDHPDAGIFGAPALDFALAAEEKTASGSIGIFRQKYEEQGSVSELGDIVIKNGNLGVYGERAYITPQGRLYIFNEDSLYVDSYNLDPYYHISGGRSEPVVPIAADYYNTVVVDEENIFIDINGYLFKYDFYGNQLDLEAISPGVHLSFCETPEGYIAVGAVGSSVLKIYDKDFGLITSYDFGNFGLADMCSPTTGKTNGIYGICTDGTDLYISTRHRHYNGSGCSVYAAYIWKVVSGSLSTSCAHPTTTPGSLLYADGNIFALRIASDTWEKYSSTPAYISTTSMEKSCGATDGTYLYHQKDDNIYVIEKMDTSYNIIGEYDLRYYNYLAGTPLAIEFVADDIGGVADRITLSVTASGESENPNAMAELYVIHVIMVSEVPEQYYYETVAILRSVNIENPSVAEIDITEYCDQTGETNIFQVYVVWQYELEETSSYSISITAYKLK